MKQPIIKSKKNLLSYIEKTENQDDLKTLVEIYFEKYKDDLESLLRTKNDNLEDVLITIIKGDPALLFKWEEAAIILKKYGYTKTILYIINNIPCDELKIASSTSVYDDYSFKILYRENQLHLLYKETKDDRILEYLIKQDINLFHYRKFKNLVSLDWNLKILDKLKLPEDASDLAVTSGFSDSLKKEDWEFICHFKINELKASEAYVFLIRNCYKKEDKKHLLDIILDSNDMNYIFNVYIKKRRILDDEYLKKFENKIEQSTDFEYKFYYKFYKNKKYLISLCGGWIALQVFLENNKDRFKNKLLYYKVCYIVDRKVLGEKSELNSKIIGAVYKDSLAETKSNNAKVMHKSNINKK